MVPVIIAFKTAHRVTDVAVGRPPSAATSARNRRFDQSSANTRICFRASV